MNNFNQLIETLLNSVQGHTEMSADEIILDAASKYGCDEAEIREVLNLLDQINEESINLDMSHEKGMTRTDWIKGKMENIAKKADDNSSTLLEGIEKGIESGLTNL